MSTYQRDIDWAKVTAAGVVFVYIRASIGVYGMDTRLDEYAKGALAAGLEVGFYHVFSPTQDGAAQAAHCRAAVNRYPPARLPVAIDYELTGANPALTAERLYALADGLESGFGRKPVIYTAKGYWSLAQIAGQHDAWFGQCPLWIAHYTSAARPALPRGWNDWAIWQYSSSGQIDGIGDAQTPVRVDLNRRRRT